MPYRPVLLTHDEAKAIGPAALKLLKKRLHNDGVATSRGAVSVPDLARALANILNVDAYTKKSCRNPEDAGEAIADYLGLHRQRDTRWYDIIGGSTSAEGVALSVARLFSDPGFVQDINRNRIKS